MNILVTGATGQLGSRIVNHILEDNADNTILVSVRDPKKAEDLKNKGIEVRHGDFDQPDTLDSAFKNVDTLVLVSTDLDTETRIRQHKTAIDAAKRAGVNEIIYTSLTKADTSTLNLAEVHKVTEQYLKDSGINYKILRNNWYLENELEGIQGALDTQVLNSAYGDGKVGWMLRDEYAKAAASAALGKGDTNTIYTLSGPLHTVDELVDTLNHITKKDITLNKLSIEDLGNGMLSAGVDAEVVEFVQAMNQGIVEGGLDDTGEDYYLLTGSNPKSLEEKLTLVLNDKK